MEPTDVPEEMLIEEEALGRLWRQRFQQPLPVADHTETIRDILIRLGVEPGTIEKAIQQERERRTA